MRMNIVPHLPGHMIKHMINHYFSIMSYFIISMLSATSDLSRVHIFLAVSHLWVDWLYRVFKGCEQKSCSQLLVLQMDILANI